MQTSDIVDNLYVLDTETGEKHTFGQIKDIELTTTEVQENIPYLNLNASESFSVEIGWHRSAHYVEMLVIGRKDGVPNNWLKMHKFPMNRGMLNRRKLYRRILND